MHFYGVIYVAQKRLVQEVPDDELFGQHKGLHDNLQSVYVQSQSTIKKVLIFLHILIILCTRHYYGIL